MRRNATFFFLPLLAAAATACSDGQIGNEGLVRFSQVVDFKQTENFGAPVAVGKTVLIALQHPNQDEETYTELRFEVLDRNGDSTDRAAAMPLGFAQYAFALFEAGDYRLAAYDGEKLLDWLDVHAEPMHDLRLAPEVRVSTHDDDCARTDETSPGDLVLHANQTATMWVVPLSRSGEPMLGLLNLTATAPDDVSLDAALIGQGQPANSLRIEAEHLHDGEIELEIFEQSEARGMRFDLPTRDERRCCDCER